VSQCVCVCVCVSMRNAWVLHAHRACATSLASLSSFVVRCSVLQCFAVRCSVLQCGAVCCSVLQCVPVCVGMLQRAVFVVCAWEALEIML